MRFGSLTLAALSAIAVSAQRDPVELSVLAVIKTIVPPDAISRALADPAAFSAEIASSLAAGKTPPWYLALPTDVKSYLPLLYPAPTAASATAPQTGVPYSTPAPGTQLTTAAPTNTAPISGTTAIPGNSTAISSISSATLKTTTGLPVATGAAPRMSAIVGAGIAGALGVVGMLL